MTRMAEQEGTVREQAETIGVTAELERATSTVASLSGDMAAAQAPTSPPVASGAPQSVEPTNGWTPVQPGVDAGRGWWRSPY